MNNATAIEMASTNVIAARVRCAIPADGTYGHVADGNVTAFCTKRTHKVHVGMAKWSHFAFPTPPRRLHEPPGF